MWSPMALVSGGRVNQLLGQVEEGGPRPCGVEGESSVEVWRWYEVAYLVAVGRAPFRRGHPYCLVDWQGARAPIAYLIGRGLAPLVGRFGDFSPLSCCS
jgi:hypothetical protein